MAQAALFTGDQVQGNAANAGQQRRERRYDGTTGSRDWLRQTAVSSSFVRMIWMV